MRRLIHALALLVGLTLLAAEPASAAWSQGQKGASGSAAVVELIASENVRLSAERAGENPALAYDLASDSPDAARGASLLGRSFGRLGTVVRNPGITIQGLKGSVTEGHAINQIITRGLSPGVVRATVANPTVVLEQAGGRFLYLTDQAALAITGEGQVVTAWGARDFGPSVLEVLSDAGMP